MDAPVAPPRTGTTIGGRYRLDELIGIGGSGEVWRATDEVLGREVALKLLRSAVTEDPAMRLTIEREVRHAAALTAVGIPAMYDVGVHDDLPFLVMELIRGESLADRLCRERSHSVRSTVEVVAAAADAVDSVGLGAVRTVAAERGRGAEPDPASDTYALGIVAYELLAGWPPFDGEPAAVLLAQVSSLPPPLPDTVPSGVRAAVMRALRADPAQRQPSAAVFAQELRVGLSGAGAPGRR